MNSQSGARSVYTVGGGGREELAWIEQRGLRTEIEFQSIAMLFSQLVCNSIRGWERSHHHNPLPLHLRNPPPRKGIRAGAIGCADQSYQFFYLIKIRMMGQGLLQESADNSPLQG